MDYQKTWEVMNSLEQSFNRVTTIGDLIDDLSESLEREDLTDSRMILNALKAYYPAFLEQYDPLPLDVAVREALDAFVTQPEASMPDIWYLCKKIW